MVSKTKLKPTISIVIPLFNEGEGIESLFKALDKVVATLPATEIIAVDDGSTDDTFAQLEKMSSKATITIVKLSRNFGHQAALLAGINQARGEYVVTMDGDLQHPPELIPTMWAEHQKGAEIVFTHRLDTTTVPLLKRLTSSLFYWGVNFLSETEIAVNVSDFRSMNRRSVEALLSLPEKRLFLRGMVQWLGFQTVTLPFTVGERQNGHSKYSFLKMAKLALFGVTSFSSSLLYFSAIISILLFGLTVIYGVYVVYVAAILKIAVSGWASMLLVVLGLGAFLSLSLSIIGMYLAAIYEEVKRRPPYIVAETIEHD